MSSNQSRGPQSKTMSAVGTIANAPSSNRGGLMPNSNTSSNNAYAEKF